MKKILIFLTLAVIIFVGGTTIDAKTTKKRSKARTSQSSKKKLYKIEGSRIIPTGHKFVVIDFYTDWCKYCPPYKEVFEKVGRNYSDRAVFIRINAEQHRDIANYYNVTGYPFTVMLNPFGTVVASFSGLVSEYAFNSFLSTYL